MLTEVIALDDNILKPSSLMPKSSLNLGQEKQAGTILRCGFRFLLPGGLQYCCLVAY